MAHSGGIVIARSGATKARDAVTAPSKPARYRKEKAPGRFGLFQRKTPRFPRGVPHFEAKAADRLW
jgi:hypothetical protein